jgi:hypothetical protein
MVMAVQSMSKQPLAFNIKMEEKARKKRKVESEGDIPNKNSIMSCS